VLESCSNPQKPQQVFESAMKKNSFLLGFGFFVSDIASGVDLGFYGPLHLALCPNRQMVVFCSKFLLYCIV